MSAAFVTTAFEIPKTQRAAVTVSYDYAVPVEFRTDYPVVQPDELQPSQVLVKMTCSGICHSDLHLRTGEWAKSPPPRVNGHEGVGVIAAMGAGTPATDGVALGSRVGIKWILSSCGRCEYCRTGRDPVCDKAIRTGQIADGTFREYVVAWAEHVVPIPEALSDEQAVPVLCAGLTVYSGLKNSDTKAGDWIVLPGAGGGLGHLAIQYAVASGLRVIAIDTGDDKKAACLKLGAEKWIDFKASANIVADVVAAAGAPGPHAALITTPSSAAYDAAIQYLRPYGTLVAIGVPPSSGPGSNFQTPIAAVVAKGLRIHGTILGNMQNAIEALDLVVRGKVTGTTIPCKLEDINRVYEEMIAGTLVGRAVIQF